MACLQLSFSGWPLHRMGCISKRKYKPQLPSDWYLVRIVTFYSLSSFTDMAYGVDRASLSGGHWHLVWHGWKTFGRVAEFLPWAISLFDWPKLVIFFFFFWLKEPEKVMLQMANKTDDPRFHRWQLYPPKLMTLKPWSCHSQQQAYTSSLMPDRTSADSARLELMFSIVHTSAWQCSNVRTGNDEQRHAAALSWLQEGSKVEQANS